jgi:hypothetical protein
LVLLDLDRFPDGLGLRCDSGYFPRFAWLATSRSSSTNSARLKLRNCSQLSGGNAMIMHDISTGISFEQMQAVAAFLMSK